MTSMTFLLNLFDSMQVGENNEALSLDLKAESTGWIDMVTSCLIRVGASIG